MSIQAISNQPQIWTGASGGAVRSQKLASLFSSIDTAGTGSITKSQFEDAMKTADLPPSLQGKSADAIWTQLDPGGTGAVSKQDFISGMQKVMRAAHHGHHHHGGGGSAAPATPAPAPASTDATATSGSVNILA